MRALGNEDVAVVQLMGEHDHEVLAGLPPERVAEDISDSPRGGDGGDPARGTAARDDLRLADRRLGGASLPRPRRGEGDPAPRAANCSGSAVSALTIRPAIAGWTDHLTLIRRRAARLTKLDLAEVHLRDRGTDLRVRDRAVLDVGAEAESRITGAAGSR